MTRQAALNGYTESEPVLCAFFKSKQTTYNTSTLVNNSVEYYILHITIAGILQNFFEH